MNVGFLQFAPVFGKTKQNLETIARIVRERGRSADLIVLPELAGTGYLFHDRREVLRLAEPFPGGPTSVAFKRLAREFDMVIIGGFAERAGGRAYNSSALVRPDGTFEVYRKTHLFLDEKDNFDPGSEPIRPFHAGGTSIGMMICFDWYFPEVTRLLALGGARIICHPSNLVLPHAPEAMKTRCIENCVYSITANRSGFDERGGRRLDFTGMSQVVGPDGKILARAPRGGEHLEVVAIDPEVAANKSITPRNNWIDDRRKELYGGLL